MYYTLYYPTDNLSPKIFIAYGGHFGFMLITENAQGCQSGNPAQFASLPPIYHFVQKKLHRKRPFGFYYSVFPHDVTSRRNTNRRHGRGQLGVYLYHCITVCSLTDSENGAFLCCYRLFKQVNKGK